MAKDISSFNGIIGITTFTKLVLNITRRLAYPFAPAFARGLNVELSAVTALIAMTQASSFMGPVGAWFADRYGYKIIMLAAVAMLTIGTFAAGLIPVYSVVVVSLFLAAMAKSIFDPTLQAFIGKYVPISQRGKVIGITEISWAGSTLAGIPLAGILIERFSWQVPFWILSILSLVCFFLILKFMPKDKASDRSVRPDQAAKVTPANWKTIFKNRQALGLFGFGFFMTLANDNLFVIYGAWLEKSYGLSLAAIGFGTIFIGLSEILGEGSTALFSDRIGLKRSVVGGTVLSAAAYMILPAADTGLGWTLAGMFLVFFSFEFTYVTSMSLGTELVPELRASTMAAFFAIAGLGRVIGAFSGGMVWSGYGIQGISLVSGVCTTLALAALLTGFSGSKK